MRSAMTVVLVSVWSTLLLAADGEAIVGNSSPYHPGRHYPKLTTPQWVGEEGVDAVVILAIDDMRDTAKYEQYLRPILTRLKKIDGRAPVSIMTNRVKPEDPQLQSWLDEGLSIECHTVDHPCPLLTDGDFDKAKSTYDRCIDLLAAIPRNKPVAFRMPCCDSLNTVSPRFFWEIFNKTTPQNNYLTIDTSVFQFFTSDDPDIPRELIIDGDGQDKFLKYLPKDRGFVNYIENYPYPYVVNKQCWEFPCVAPSDWSAQHKHGVNNPVTVEDWKAALDITVIKQGVFCLVFHPHGWISSEQIVELIDHAEQKHGKKVKFLTFREAARRLNENFYPLRGSRSAYPIDLNRDGYLDRWCRNHLPLAHETVTHEWGMVWNTGSGTWTRSDAAVTAPRYAGTFRGRHIFAGRTKGENGPQFLEYDPAKGLLPSTLRLPEDGPNTPVSALPIDLDSDGTFELITGGTGTDVWKANPDNTWRKLDIHLPRVAVPNHPLGCFADWDRLLVTFFDVDSDGLLDVVYPQQRDPLLDSLGVADQPAAAFRLQSLTDGWEKLSDLPPPARQDGTHNGFFIHGRAMYWMNEDTAKEPHLVTVRTFDDLLADIPKKGRESFSASVHQQSKTEEQGQNSRPRPPSTPKAKSPQVSLSCINVREGFRVELVAAEPLVRDPIAFDWLPDGRMIVVEMGGYPNGVDDAKPLATEAAQRDQTAPTNGRVRILEDTDSDGVYDKATTFLDNLNFPTGVMPWRNGVLISAAPDILYAEDTNGDGRADQREVLFTGFNEGNQQHRVNGFEYGLDNWVYIANGDSGGTIRSIRTGKTLDVRGHDLRIKPDTGEMQIVSGRTQYGRHRDAWGNWFGCNNSNPMWHYVLNEHQMSRNPHFAAPDTRHTVPDVPGNAPVFPASTTPERFNDFHTANRFTSACSTIVYDDALFGRHYQHNAFVCEPVHNLVSRLVLQAEGVTFRGSRAVDETDREFLASTDNWFRPVFVRTGPDGALWVADMYRHVIEHPEWIPDDWQKRLDLRAGHDMGRIYRVVPVTEPAFETKSVFPLATRPEGLRSPARWIRDNTQRLLATPETLHEHAVTMQEMVQTGATPHERLHALCTLFGMDVFMIDAIDDPSPLVRRHAYRMFRDHPDPARIEALTSRAQAAQPSELMELAYTLGSLDDPRAAGGLGTILKNHAHDPFVTAAVLSGFRKSNAAAVLSAVLQSENASPGLVRTAFALASRSKDPAQLKIGAIEIGKFARAKGDPGYQTAFWALTGLYESIRPQPPKPDIPEAARESLGKVFLAALLVMQQPGESTRSPEFVADAVRFFGAFARGEGYHFEDVVDTATALLAPTVHPTIRDAAIAETGRFGGPAPAEFLLNCWPQSTPATRSRIVDQLLAREAWTKRLLAELRDGRIRPVEIDAARRTRLLDHRNGEVRTLATQVFDAATSPDRAALVTRMLSRVTEAGNEQAGRAVFEKRCAACHRLDGVGNQIGADLASLKDKSTAALLTAILDPNRAVEARFLSYTAVTDDGRTFSGMIRSESGNAIALVGSDGKQQSVLRSDIDELVCSNKSLMPEGLEKDLSETDLANVIAFVQSGTHATAPKSFSGNKPQIVAPDAQGQLRLTARDCEIRGPNLVFESHYGNLGFWASEADHAIWNVTGVQPGRYRVLTTLAAPNDVAGQTFRVIAGAKHIQAKVASTGDWNRYRQFEAGILEVPSEITQIRVQAAGSVKGYLMDLRELLLVPVERGDD